MREAKKPITAVPKLHTFHLVAFLLHFGVALAGLDTARYCSKLVHALFVSMFLDGDCYVMAPGE